MKLRTWGGILLLCMFASPSGVMAIVTVGNVQVSATAASIAEAREQALDKGHQLAYQKLLEENFPESHRPTPPHDTLMDMVTNFSIDREKTSSDNKTYTASLTFKFDSERTHEWLQQETISAASSSRPSLAPSVSTLRKGPPLKVTIFYGSHPEWRQIKRALEESPEGQSVKVIHLSSKTAHVELPYGGDGIQLQQRLKTRGITLVLREGVWTIPLADSRTSRDGY